MLRFAHPALATFATGYSSRPLRIIRQTAMDAETLIAARKPETILQKSEWLEDLSAEQSETLYDEFDAYYESFRKVFEQKLGSPSFNERSSPAEAEEMYPEAMRLTAWKRPGGVFILAFGQHDQETPIFVSFGYRPDEQLGQGG